MKQYLRFEMLTVDRLTGWPDGLFVTAYKIVGGEAGEVDSQSRMSIEELIAWFRSNLAIPTRFNSTTSKGLQRRNTAGISWFKPVAILHIAKMRELAVILREHGFPVVERTTARPGKVVYEDEHQIVAEPFRSET